MPTRATIGAMDQWVDWQANEIPVWPMQHLERKSGQMTASNPAVPHNFATGDEVAIDGVVTDPSLNKTVIITVVDATTFYWNESGPDETEGGQVTATYLGDGMGGRRDTWTTRGMLAAEVVAVPSVSGNETIQAAAVQANVLYRVRIWRVAIEPMHRLVWEGLVLHIVGILRTGDVSFLVLNCTEGNPL